MENYQIAVENGLFFGKISGQKRQINPVLLVNGKVVINGPLNINHKPIIQLVNFTTRDDLADQKFLLPLQQVGMKIHQVVNSLKDAVVVAAATNRTLGKYKRQNRSYSGLLSIPEFVGYAFLNSGRCPPTFGPYIPDCLFSAPASTSRNIEKTGK